MVAELKVIQESNHQHTCKQHLRVEQLNTGQVENPGQDLYPSETRLKKTISKQSIALGALIAIRRWTTMANSLLVTILRKVE